MRPFYLILSGICLFASLQSYAQDPSYSQFYASPMYLNPALTGFNSGITINSHYRNQWWQIQPGRSKFTTQSLGVSGQIPDLQSAFGLSYDGNVEGEGLLTWHSVGLNYAFVIPFADQDFWNYKGDIRFGINLSRNWRTLNWNNLVFTGQLDPIYGIVDEPQIPANLIEYSEAAYFDSDFGMAFRWDATRVGFAAHHWIRPYQSLLYPGSDVRLPTRFTFHASHILEYDFVPDGGQVRQVAQVIPSIKVDMQKAISQISADYRYVAIDYGVAFALKPRASRLRESFGGISLYGGVWHHTRQLLPSFRHTDAVIFLLGFKTEEPGRGRNSYRYFMGPEGKEPDARRNAYSYDVGISYEYNVNGLGSVSGGAFEASLTINFPNRFLFKANPNRRINVHRKCPPLYR